MSWIGPLVQIFSMSYLCFLVFRWTNRYTKLHREFMAFKTEQMIRDIDRENEIFREEFHKRFGLSLDQARKPRTPS